MPWLKYRHKFAHGKGSWEWRDLGVEPDSDSVASICSDLAELYNFFDKYRGLDHEVVEDRDVPRTIVEWAIKINAARFKHAEQVAQRLDEQIALGLRPCDRCGDRGQATPALGIRVENCPECGRERAFARCTQIRPDIVPCNDERCTRKRGHKGACKFPKTSFEAAFGIGTTPDESRCPACNELGECLSQCPMAGFSREDAWEQERSLKGIIE